MHIASQLLVAIKFIDKAKTHMTFKNKGQSFQEIECMDMLQRTGSANLLNIYEAFEDQ